MHEFGVEHRSTILFVCNVISSLSKYKIFLTIIDQIRFFFQFKAKTKLSTISYRVKFPSSYRRKLQLSMKWHFFVVSQQDVIHEMSFYVVSRPIIHYSPFWCFGSKLLSIKMSIPLKGLMLLCRISIGFGMHSMLLTHLTLPFSKR